MFYLILQRSLSDMDDFKKALVSSVDFLNGVFLLQLPPRLCSLACAPVYSDLSMCIVKGVSQEAENSTLFSRLLVVKTNHRRRVC